MYETFDLPVRYKNETQMLPAQLVQTGYTHSFRVEIDGRDVFFEPDEEGAYRAIVKPEELGNEDSLRVELLEAVATAIADVLR